jgi:histidine triad (HIT) family protein
MNDCLFCKIIVGEIPSEKVYESNETYAFLDINPVNPGHTLVIPKKHYERIYDVSKDLWSAVTETVRILSPAIKKAMDADGINIGMNNDEAAGQVIFHTHVHIIPRFRDDALEHWPKKPYRKGGLEKTGEKIRSQL